MSTIPNGWTDDGTTLTAPNGHKIIQGFRGWVLTHNWDPQNVPLEDVQSVNPVEDYFTQNPSGGTRQLFLFEELGWTQARGVYVVGIGNELKGARAERDKLKAQAATLQGENAALKSLLASSNLGQINTLGKQIFDDVALIMKLSQVQ